MNNENIDNIVKENNIDTQLIDKIAAYKNSDSTIGANDIILFAYHYLEPYHQDPREEFEKDLIDPATAKKPAYVIGQNILSGEKIYVNTGDGLTFIHLYKFLQDKSENSKTGNILNQKALDGLLNNWELLTEKENLLEDGLLTAEDVIAYDCDGALIPYKLNRQITETLREYLKKNGALEKLKSDSLPVTIFKEFEITSPFHKEEE